MFFFLFFFFLRFYLDCMNSGTRFSSLKVKKKKDSFGSYAFPQSYITVVVLSYSLMNLEFL